MKAVLNRTRTLQGLMLACAVLLATSAFAANKGSFELMHPTQVAGKELPPGTYKVQWEGSGNDVHLNILKGKNQVASTNARILQMPVASQEDNALVNLNQDGSRSLSQIRFRGKTFALDLTGEGAGAGSGGAGR